MHEFKILGLGFSAAYPAHSALQFTLHLAAAAEVARRAKTIVFIMIGIRSFYCWYFEFSQQRKGKKSTN